MDWTLAITRNREALLRIVAALFALAGLVENATSATLPRQLRNRVLRILRPAESAVRRLIVMAARGVEGADTPLSPGGRESGFDGLAEPSAKAKRQKSQERGVRCGRQSRPIDNDLSIGAPNARRHGGGPKTKSNPNRLPSLPLFDPLKRFETRRKTSKSFPRISFIGLTEPCPLPPVPSPDDPVSAERLGRRLAALKQALDDIEGQAKRLVRWKARRISPAESPEVPTFSSGLARRTKRTSPFRPGWPPGYRKRKLHEVDDVLADCHSLALAALEPPET